MKPESTPLRGGVKLSFYGGAGHGLPLEEIETLYNSGRFDRVVHECRNLLAVLPPEKAQERRRLSLLLGKALIRLHRIAESDAFRIEAVLAGDIPEGSFENSVLKCYIWFFEDEHRMVMEESTRWINQPEQLTPVILAEFFLLRGRSHYRLGDSKQAIQDIEFANHSFTQEKAWSDVFVATNLLGLIAISQGRLQAALGWYEQCTALQDTLDTRGWMATNMINLGIIHYKLGSLDQAEECVKKALGIEQIPVLRRILATIALGNVYRLQGKHQLARRTLQEAVRLSRQNHNIREEALSLEFLGDVERDDGRPQEARKLYAQALKLGMDIAPRGDLVMELLRRDGECLDLLGRYDDAESTLQRSLTLAQDLGDKFEQGVILRCLGVNAANREEYGQAEQYFDKALKYLVKIQARHEEMILRLKMAQMYYSRIVEDHEVA